MFQLMTFAVLTVTPSAPVPKQQPLQWKIAKGDTFYVKTKSKSQVEISLMGNEQKHEQTTSGYSRFVVTSVTDKGYVIEETYEKLEGDWQGTNLEEVSQLLKGSQLIYETDRQLKVLKIKGVDAMIGKLDKVEEPAKANLTQMLGDESQRLGFAEIFGQGPDKAVNVGDRWTHQVTFPFEPFGSLKLDKNYKYVSAEGGDKVTYTTRTEYVASKVEEPFKVTAGELKAESWEGEYLFDSLTGRLKTSRTSMKLNGDFTIGVGCPNIKLTMKMNMTIENTLSDKSLAK